MNHNVMRWKSDYEILDTEDCGETMLVSQTLTNTVGVQSGTMNSRTFRTLI